MTGQSQRQRALRFFMIAALVALGGRKVVNALI
jgi:hypothetical protein